MNKTITPHLLYQFTILSQQVESDVSINISSLIIAVIILVEPVISNFYLSMKICHHMLILEVTG